MATLFCLYKLNTMFWNSLPHSDNLFRKYYTPWFPQDNKRKKCRPDMYVINAYLDKPLLKEEIEYLPSEIISEVKATMAKMREAYLKDYATIIEFDTFDLAVLELVDQFFNEQRVKEIVKQSNPKDFNNLYLISTCEFGLALGDLFVQTGKFEWLYSYPYFNSMVVNLESGEGVPVFDWAVKKFSSYGINDGYKWKFNEVIRIIFEKTH